MTCDECRVRMCTNTLLTNLRCAHCRQIRLERIYDFAAQAFLMALGGMCGWLLARPGNGDGKTPR
jgi:hypothetical protein